MASVVSCVICHDCDKTLRFFHVPSDPARLESWSELLKLQINTSSIVCEKHFLEEHFTKNSELNCWRINSKAIPTLQLTSQENADIKFINEHDFDTEIDKRHKTDAQNEGLVHAAKQAGVKCLWCDDCFEAPDLRDILKHLKNKHHYEIVEFFESDEEEFKEVLTPKATQDDVKQLEAQTMELADKDDEFVFIESCEDDGIDKQKESVGANDLECTDNSDDEEMSATLEFEECNLKDELTVQTNFNNNIDRNIDEIFEIATEKALNAPLNGVKSDKQIDFDIETSEPSLIFDIIDLLQRNPTIWFLNCFKSKEFEAGLTKFYEDFTVKYQTNLTLMQLHELLIEIRDWYLKIHEAETCDELTYPQSDYFWKLAEFLPDQPHGKTCDLCGLLFNDHIQYFGHRKLQHDLADEDENENNEETTSQIALAALKKHSRDYFYARYPLGQGGFSYQCQNCPASYVKFGKKTFYEHIKTHLDIRDHVCDICGKSFVVFDRLKRHRKRHLGTYKFPCKICGKEFNHGSLLTSHRVRYHRPLEGTIEEIEFRATKRRTNPDSGIITTFKLNGEKIYTCALCGKTYNKNPSAWNHRRRAHADFKPKLRRSRKSKE